MKFKLLDTVVLTQGRRPASSLGFGRLVGQTLLGAIGIGVLVSLKAGLLTSTASAIRLEDLFHLDRGLCIALPGDRFDKAIRLGFKVDAIRRTYSR